MTYSSMKGALSYTLDSRFERIKIRTSNIYVLKALSGYDKINFVSIQKSNHQGRYALPVRTYSYQNFRTGFLNGNELHAHDSYSTKKLCSYISYVLSEKKQIKYNSQHPKTVNKVSYNSKTAAFFLPLKQCYISLLIITN